VCKIPPVVQGFMGGGNGVSERIGGHLFQLRLAFPRGERKMGRTRESKEGGKKGGGGELDCLFLRISFALPSPHKRGEGGEEENEKKNRGQKKVEGNDGPRMVISFINTDPSLESNGKKKEKRKEKGLEC